MRDNIPRWSLAKSCLEINKGDGLYMQKQVSRWRSAVNRARNAEHISLTELLSLFRGAHEALAALRDSDTVPREACQLIMLLDEFTYYTTMVDENYFDEERAGLWYLNYALKSMFFRGAYQSAFFVGEMDVRMMDFLSQIDTASEETFARFLKTAAD